MNSSMEHNSLLPPGTLNKSVFGLNILFYIMLFPTLALIFNWHNFVIGSIALILLVSISTIVTLTAEFKIDPILRRRPRI